MFHIQTYNDIAPQGLKRFDSEFYKLNEKMNRMVFSYVVKIY